MPKHIKALKCPQCGSTRATQIREDHYRCESCSTEFYLDSDDITVHHKVETGADRSNPISSLWNTATASPRRNVLIILAITLFFSFMAIMGYIVSGSSSNYTAGAYGYGDDRTSYSLEQLGTFTTTAGRPIVVLFGSARPMSSSHVDDDQAFVSFYDGETQEVVKEIELPDLKGRIQKLDMRQFADGAVYVIFNEAHLYRIDCSTLDMKEVHGEDYKRPELNEGFAEVVFYYVRYGDALKIKTNLGQRFVYYPVADKLYPEKEAYDALQESLPTPKVATHFAFSIESSDYPDRQLQLIRHSTLEQDGYPREYPRFRWERGSGRDFGKTVLIPSYGEKRARLQGYEDLTPGAYYFSPRVLHVADDRILISFKPSASSEAKHMLRCLDAQAGKVLWSLSDEEDRFKNGAAVSRFSGGYVLVGYSEAYLVSNDGKLVSSTDYRKRIEGR